MHAKVFKTLKNKIATANPIKSMKRTGRRAAGPSLERKN
jgi:hypothetical protein